MNKPFLDILIGLIVTLVSFGFVYDGLKMLKHKKKMLIWPARIIFALIAIWFGVDMASRRKDYFLNKTQYYETSVLIGGILGVVGGLIWLVDALLRIT